jgi:hypothetical protein
MLGHGVRLPALPVRPGAPGCFPRLRFSALASARRSALFLRGPIGSDEGGLPVVEESALSSASKRETMSLLPKSFVLCLQ